MALVVPLRGAGAARAGLVGGKALNLAVLMAASFPVPPGFVVTSRGLRARGRGPGRRAAVRPARAGELGLRRRHLPRLLLTDGTGPEPLGVAAEVPGALVGSPASAGIVTGRARVVLNPVGARLGPGKILRRRPPTGGARRCSSRQER